MEIKPVKNAEKPNYPLKDEVNLEQLKDSVPKRWAGSRVAKIAFGALALTTLTGCVTDGAPVPPSVASVDSCLTNSPDISMFAGAPTPAPLKVAPLFSHGDGRGGFGCVMVAPPVFLSEEDALAVINEAALEYGLTFSAYGTPEFSNIRQPVADLTPPLGDASPTPVRQGDFISLKADFADSEHGIAIEFVSVDDVKKWSSGPSKATVEEYNMKDAAEQLSDSLDEAYLAGYDSAAVLYDPCDFSKNGSEASTMSKTDLKAQAIDFFKWLKAQGII